MNSQTLKPTDIKAARELSRLFAQHKGHSTQLQIGSEQITLPKNVLQIILEVTTQLASGHQVSVVSKDSDLTTAQTAELLNVSRPYVVQLLNDGKLPFRMVGTHRRVLLEDAMQYKEAQRKKSLEIMEELSRESREMDLETRAWSDDSAYDLAVSLAQIEKDIPEAELQTWLEANHKAAKPVQYLAGVGFVEVATR